MIGGSPFKPEDIVRLKETQAAFQRLEKFDNVWIGADLTLEKPAVVQPGQLLRDVKIVANKKDLPDLGTIDRGVLKFLGLSTRSFYAQTGINISFHPEKVSDEILKNINSGQDTLLPIDVMNYGQRAVEIDGKVMRFFWANDSKRLRRKDLVNKIKSGEFFVDGVEGKDWYLGGHNEEDKFTTENGTDEALCVVVRLKPERFYIPDAQQPIRKNKSMGTRENLAGLLKPVPEGEEIDFDIRETPWIRLGPNIIAVINTGWTDQHQKHINSPLVDPGFDWPIRTEGLHGLDYVEFFLYEK
ncbi:MAG TPA: hypothetical protein VJB95_02625 [Candidatus Paceibacterota bacterium]